MMSSSLQNPLMLLYFASQFSVYTKFWVDPQMCRHCFINHIMTEPFVDNAVADYDSTCSYNMSIYNTAFLQQIQLETTSQAQNQEQSRARPSRCQLSFGQRHTRQSL